MESAMFTSPCPLLAPLPLALARTMFPRIAPSAIAMENHRPKNMAYSGIGATSASRIIAEWATWRRQACEQLLLEHDRHSILALSSLQAVSTMLEASFHRARAAAEDDHGSGRRALWRQIAQEGTPPAGQESSPCGSGCEERLEREKHVRDPPSLCGWHRRTHIMARELQGLSEHRAVSAFAHRGCIESFLRCRFFFHGGWPVHDEEGSVSMATREIATNPSMPLGAQSSAVDSEHHGFTDQVLRDHDHEVHTFQSMEDESVNVENTLPDSNDDLQDDIDDEQMIRPDDEYSDSGSSGQGSDQSGSSSATLSDNAVRQEAVFLHIDDDVIDSQEAVETQLQPDQSFYSPTYNNWIDHPVDGFYGVELPELLSRGSVSNLLRSGFGESLDQLLMQSYALRQEFVEREMLNTAASVTEDHVDHAINEQNTAEHNRPWIVSSGQGARRRQWYWTRPEFVLDAIQEIEIDMVGLYSGMASMQQMVEECLDMQMEVQRSIKQEVSAAMNRSRGVQGSDEGQQDGPSRWHLGHLVRKGTCCICSDNQIDSVMYRCGHMCTCSKCARELLNGDGKCPMCRAPIVDVVQAYTA